MDIMELHQKTFDWLDNEAARYVRLFQLAKTKKERESAKKKLEEIRGRLSVERRSVKKIMDYQS
jgi:hypothetical protein